MTSNYNLRRGANPAQDQAGDTAGEPDMQSQSQTQPGFQSQAQPGVQSQTNQQKSQESSFQTSESTKQVRV